jgi:hypothetical protein
MEEEHVVHVVMAPATPGKSPACKVTLTTVDDAAAQEAAAVALSPTKSSSPSPSKRMKGLSPPHVSPLKNGLEEKVKTPLPSPYSPLKQGKEGLERRISGGASPMREAFEVAAAFETGKSPPRQQKEEEAAAKEEAFNERLSQFKLFSGETTKQEDSTDNQVNATAAQYEKRIQKPKTNKPAKSILERMKMFEK